MSKELVFLCTLLLVIFLVATVFKMNMPRTTKKLKKGDYQVVVVVNKDLEMSKGKVLSQFGHAIDALHEKLKDNPKLVEVWRNSGSAKIAVKGTQDDLNKVHFEAKKRNILYVKIHDAGKTQVRPGSNTVIVVGPATKDDLEPVTGNLKLY